MAPRTKADIAVTNAQQNVALAQIQGSTSVQEAQIQASAQKKSSDNSLLGGIIGGIFSIF